MQAEYVNAVLWYLLSFSVKSVIGKIVLYLMYVQLVFYQSLMHSLKLIFYSYDIDTATQGGRI